ncbi:hypothetical protein FNF28_03257 [Cafeteria roenbergensis]|uniref:Uncharacterized protein n=1 Tax=Cafeteria roenbergensis TaxID=33653 RepID=A0A5A8DLR2_CAFRO|nr:hypothetical protein FNF28_03257 [Cafeteria roenbergensis]
MSTSSAVYSGERGAWGDALRELKAQLAESAPRAVRAKGLVSLRSSLDAVERGDLDSELSGVLAGAVRLSKASTSNTDDNKIIRAAFAAATTAARVAPPSLPAQEHKEKDAAAGTDGSVRGAARLEAARAAAAAAAPLLQDRLPPTAVLRVVAAAASALASVRPSAIAAQSDARRGKRTSLVALSTWAGAAIRERSPRSLALAVTLLRCVADVAAGIATGDSGGASARDEARGPSGDGDDSGSETDPTAEGQGADAGDADADSAAQARVQGLLVREGIAAAPGAATIDSDPRPAEILLPLLQALAEGLRPCDDTSSGLPIAPVRGSPEATATALRGGGAPLAVETVLVAPLAVAASAVTPLPSLGAPHAAWLVDSLQGACALPGVPARRLLEQACEALRRRGGPPAALAVGLLDATEGVL